MESVNFTTFSTTGISYGDDLFTWMTKFNGLITEVVDANTRHSQLVTALYPSGSPNWVTLNGAQSITGVKTFDAGSLASPTLKIGTSGFFYTNSGGVNRMGVTTNFLVNGSLSVGGEFFGVNGQNYSMPSAGPAAGNFSFMTAIRGGSANGDHVFSFKQANTIVDGSTLVFSGSTFSVGVVQSANIANASITNAKMAANSVGGSNIIAGSVDPTKLSSGAPTWTSTGNVTSTGALNYFGEGSSAATIDFNIGRNRTTSGTSRIFLFGGTSADAKFSITRLGGDAGDLRLTNYGAGTFEIELEPTESASGDAQFVITQKGITRFKVLADGRNQIPSLAGTGARTVQCTASGILQEQSSDKRLKEDIVPMSESLELVKRLKPVSFKWKEQEEHGDKTNFGFIAQDMKKVIPSLVYETSSGMLGLDYTTLIPFLVKSIQELSAEVEQLKKAATSKAKK